MNKNRFGLLKKLFAKEKIASVDVQKKILQNNPKYSLTKRTIRHSSGKILEQFSKICTNKGNFNNAQITIKNKTGEIIGILSIENSQKYIKKNSLKKGLVISGASVELSSRKEGLLRQMVAEAEHISKKAGFERIYLSAMDGRAEKAYRKIGFKNVLKNGEEQFSDAGFFPIMVKEL
jgi:predicted acetyltransferase